MQLVNFALVILAENHNPSSFSPDLLLKMGLFRTDDPGFELSSSPVITPPMAQMNFKNGISINCDMNRLVFEDANPAHLPKFSPIPDMATKYVKQVPYVPYKAIGINFTNVLHRPDVLPPYRIEIFSNDLSTFLIEKKSDTGVRMRFQEDTFMLSVDIQYGELKAVPYWRFNFNFHKDIKDSDILEIINGIREYKNLEKASESYSKSFLKMMGM
ncbi:MAG: hypothetical protein JXA60_12250 [Candidatus Coatesbacteria bacterium]|nr:hypothetical protein [Candidatus Coatesbacteria bacterium]